MRNDVIFQIYNEMKKNKNIYFLTGDLGYSVLENIQNDFPDRFVNVGVAEQNMMGIASGLALSGKKVYVYSIIPFVTMRCFEQIRNDVCYHDLDITILGAGSGFSYGILSSTHFALEDIAILRSLPNMTIFSPADKYEAISGLKHFLEYKHPLYFRIGKKNEPEIYNENKKFNFNRPILLNKGKDGLIFSTGPITYEVIKAVNYLKKKYKLELSLYDISLIKPINSKYILNKCLSFNNVFTVEEHGIVGGIGSVLAEMLSESGTNNRIFLSRIGTNDSFIRVVGTQEYLREKMRLNYLGIARRIKNTLNKT